MDGSIKPEPPKRKRRRAPRQRNQGKAPQSWAMETLEWIGLRTLLLVFAPFSARGRSNTVGWLARTLGPRTGFAKRITENIDLVRPDYAPAQRREIVAGVMENFARTAAEYADLPDLAARSASFTIEGLEHLEAARRAGGGRLVVVSAHYGNWEAVRAVAARHNAPLAIIYRAFNNRRIDDYSYKLITACGWPAFRKGAEGSKALLKHVRSGAGALILVDQRLGGAPYLDFMGEPAETSLAAAQLARTLKAPLLPACGRREGDGFTVRFEPAIAPSDPVSMSQEMNRVIGAWVDAAPEQWFWLHRRWRRRRKGARLRRTYGRDDAARNAPTLEDEAKGGAKERPDGS